MLLPIIRLITEHFPDAEVDFLSLTSNTGILEGIDEVDNLYLLDRTNPWTLFKTGGGIIPSLRRKNYDLVIDFEQFANFSAIATALTGARYKYGFKNPAHRRHNVYTHPVAYVESGHMTEIFARLPRAAGTQPLNGQPALLPIDEKEKQRALSFLDDQGIDPGDTVVILHPGSSPNMALRRWHPDNFAQLADRLIENTGARIIYSGSTEEHSIIEEIRRGMRHPSVNASGKMGVRDYAALCAQSELVVANDTAAVHIASALGTPVVGLYGPNTPSLYGPYHGRHNLIFYSELPCSPCILNVNRKTSVCQEPACMNSISVEEVLRGIGVRYFDAQGRLLQIFRKDRRRSRKVAVA